MLPSGGQQVTAAQSRLQNISQNNRGERIFDVNTFEWHYSKPCIQRNKAPTQILQPMQFSFKLSMRFLFSTEHTAFGKV
jgi:hypothetical protein